MILGLDVFILCDAALPTVADDLKRIRSSRIAGTLCGRRETLALDAVPAGLLRLLRLLGGREGAVELGSDQVEGAEAVLASCAGRSCWLRI